MIASKLFQMISAQIHFEVKKSKNCDKISDPANCSSEGDFFTSREQLERHDHKPNLVPSEDFYTIALFLELLYPPFPAEVLTPQKVLDAIGCSFDRYLETIRERKAKSQCFSRFFQLTLPAISALML